MVMFLINDSLQNGAVTITDRHDCAIGVVALIPTFQDRGTKISALASESVTTLVTSLI